MICRPLTSHQILNVTGFRKALKKFEKVTRVRLSFRYISQPFELELLVDPLHRPLHAREGRDQRLRLGRSSTPDDDRDGGPIRDTLWSVSQLRRTRSGQPYLCYQQFTATRNVRWPVCALVHRKTAITSAHSVRGWLSGWRYRRSLRGYTTVRFPQIHNSCFAHPFLGFQPEVRHGVQGWEALLYIYAIMLVPVLLAMLIGLNMLVWARTRINYVFIFGEYIFHSSHIC